MKANKSENVTFVICCVCNKSTKDDRFWTTQDEPLCDSCYNDLLETYLDIREYQNDINIHGR